MPQRIAVRVYFGSCEPEYHLYEDGTYTRYWSVYRDGKLPEEYKVGTLKEVLNTNE